MLEEQAEKAAITENTSETVEEVKQDTVVDDYVAPTKEEYTKAIQSAQSKAKFEILKELGIKNVSEFKDKQKQYDDAIKAKDELSERLSKFEKDIANLNEEKLIMKTGLKDEYKEDALTLARSKVGDNKNLESALEEVLSKNPSWRSGPRGQVRIGSEKSEVKEDQDGSAKSDISSRVYKNLGLKY